ncbi:lectin subunit alpha-like [Lucilia sericata]|uniref:lectin subunit alpha-like n=1 Tax=Lucilia sericata TaxID=13632 RepID=UPI0018A86A94|nr:lectin subunit alpha-like [Lucilia sericata]
MRIKDRLKFLLFINIIFICLLNDNVSVAKNINKAYLIEEQKFLTWQNALDYCKNMSMTLFKIENYDEFEYLKSIIKAKYGRIFPYWLGAYKINGIFKWVETGENVKLFLWHAGEPNDKSGHEKCIHTWEEDFDWNDNDCERELPFICELKD